MRRLSDGCKSSRHFFYTSRGAVLCIAFIPSNVTVKQSLHTGVITTLPDGKKYVSCASGNLPDGKKSARVSKRLFFVIANAVKQSMRVHWIASLRSQ
jgi:hypothetical protein